MKNILNTDCSYVWRLHTPHICVVALEALATMRHMQYRNYILHYIWSSHNLATSKELRHQKGRPRQTWQQTVSDDLNIGLHSTYKCKIIPSERRLPVGKQATLTQWVCHPLMMIKSEKQSITSQLVTGYLVLEDLPGMFYPCYLFI